jgi:uncharacterized protein (TIGR02996 family)
MSDEERLLAQIRDRPDDDQPRRVYADALLARGDDRGEYVHLSLDLALATSPLPPAKAARWHELGERENGWAKELGLGALSSVRWNRGLPHEVWGCAEDVVAERELLRRFPIRKINLYSDQRDLAQLAAIAELAWIDDLTLLDFEYPRGWGAPRPAHPTAPRPPLAHAEVAALCASPHLERLRTLTIHPHLDDRNCRSLGSAPWLAQLEVLLVRNIGEGFAHLFAGELPMLRHLEVADSAIGEAGGRAFGEAKLPGLESVNFAKAGLGAGTRFVLGSRTLATVRTLRITNDGAFGTGAILGSSPHTHALRAVTLDDTGFGSADILALTTGSGVGFPALESLGLGDNRIDDAGAIALGSSSRFLMLATLQLPDNLIGDPGAAALASSPNLPRLASLGLSGNRLTRDGALALANRTGLPALRHLGLAHNPFPSGQSEPLIYDENQYVLGGGDIPLPFDDIKALFAHHPELRVS